MSRRHGCDKDAPAEASLLRSPRTNLRAFLSKGAASSSADPTFNLGALEGAIDAASSALIDGDAEAKLRRKKLYLVLDLDETLVYSQRMAPGAKPKGTQISVRGSPFDCVTRPGLSHFLKQAHQNFVVFLYTMGDQEYTEAVLKVIDPESKYFKGAPRSHTHVHKCESDRHENNNLFPPFSSSSQAASAAGVPPSRGRSRTSRGACATGA